MVIVSYDISDDKLRTKFSKYLSRFGHRLQYTYISNKFEKSFTQEDSVMIFKMSSNCEVLRFGYAKNDEKDFIVIQ